MNIDYPIPLPTQDEPAQVLGVFHSVMTALGLELGHRYDAHCSTKIGPNWFAALQVRKKQEGRPPIHLYDPSFVLNEPLHDPKSPLRDCLPRSAALFNQLEDVIDVRNVWNHYGAEQTLAELENALGTIHMLATMAEMRLGGPIKSVRLRIKAILSGEYPPKSPTPEDSPQDVPSGIEVTPEERERLEDDRDRFVAEAPLRPPIGSRWSGSVPDRRAKLTSLGDLIDAESGASLRPQLAGDAGGKLRRWASLRPMGDLRIADDGAVAAFLGGELRLVGYLGEEPDVEGPRGFVLPHSYEVRGGDIVDRSSGTRLSSVVPPQSPSPLTRRPADGIVLRVTTEGDLAVFGEDRVEKVGAVTSNVWFPGHLP